MYVTLEIVSSLYIFLAEISEFSPILVDSIHSVTAIRPVKIALRHTDRQTDTRKIIDKFRNRFQTTLTIFSPNYQELLQGLIIYIRSGH